LWDACAGLVNPAACDGGEARILGFGNDGEWPDDIIALVAAHHPDAGSV
jgi:hypothetical protein